MRASALALFLTGALVAPLAASAEGAPPNARALIGPAVIADVRSWLDAEIVRLSVESQNERYATVDAAQIEVLDRQWRAEREAADKPLIAATLSSPLSVYLTRIQARSLGLYAEVFVTDDKGLNVGQSSITSDFWQGDEAKYQKTFPLGVDAVFVDDPEWDDELKVWRAQLNLTVSDATGRTPIGSATIEINLTELMRRSAAISG